MSELAAALGLHSLGLFSLTVLVLNATPGVDMLYTVSRTLTGGARTGVAAALGVSAGCVVHALLAAFGLAALLAVSSLAFATLKWAGAAYLAWVALQMLRSAARPAETQAAQAAEARQRSLPAVFRQGMVTNVLNPKVALFFLAFLPQFIAPDAPHKTLAFLALGALMVTQGTVFLLALVAVSARLRRLGGSPTLSRWLNGLGGALFLGLAARLALVEHRV
ncbi:LysE family translocator [Ideonella azotifigens]|uniref:LysE family translocator n=1 Tax=Ideonella azotifigens TaxID=513160 RepID=A0ABN1KE78_9BURK|nr:LysE family translocator [Ideonella azotifigens]MCD2344567.1 LysE family translocator [Ideonella azotifigens]